VETIPGAVAAIVGSSTTRYYSDAPHYFILCDQNLAPTVERSHDTDWTAQWSTASRYTTQTTRRASERYCALCRRSYSAFTKINTTSGTFVSIVGLFVTDNGSTPRKHKTRLPRHAPGRGGAAECGDLIVKLLAGLGHVHQQLWGLEPGPNRVRVLVHVVHNLLHARLVHETERATAVRRESNAKHGSNVTVAWVADNAVLQAPHSLIHESENHTVRHLLWGQLRRKIRSLCTHTHTQQRA
jgi:hypothetical protein